MLPLLAPTIQRRCFLLPGNRVEQRIVEDRDLAQSGRLPYASSIFLLFPLVSLRIGCFSSLFIKFSPSVSTSGGQLLNRKA